MGCSLRTEHGPGLSTELKVFIWKLEVIDASAKT